MKEKNIYFNENLSDETYDDLFEDFKDWAVKEFNKRLTKKGKLFEFNITLYNMLYYGNTHVLFSEQCMKIKILNEKVLAFIDEFVKENNLELIAIQSGGTSICYTVVRK